MNIKLNNVTITYDKHPAIHHLNGEFKKGSMTAVVGPNGSGKTTLLKTIAGLLEPVEGNLNLDKITRKDIAYLPQQSEIDKQFPISVIDFIKFSLFEKVGIFSRINQKNSEKAKQALQTVGLAGFEERSLSSLSSGQLQRVLFARTMLQDAKIILLDEPFNAIDAKTTSDLLYLIKRWNNEERTIIAVIHDLEQVRENFPETLLIARQPIAWGKTQDSLAPANLLQARRMMESWPENAKPCKIA